MESVCLSSMDKDFHIVGAEDENEQGPSVFVCSLGI